MRDTAYLHTGRENPIQTIARAWIGWTSKVESASVDHVIALQQYSSIDGPSASRHRMAALPRSIIERAIGGGLLSRRENLPRARTSLY